MNPNEYSEEVRRVVRVVGDGFHVSVDISDFARANALGLIILRRKGMSRATLSPKGCELLRAMKYAEMEDAAEAPIEFEATCGHTCGIDGAFPNVPYGMCVKGARYRVALTPIEREVEPKPKPVEPPSWDDAPEYAEWRGQNLNGAWYWYHSRPEQSAFSCYETTPLVRWKPGMYGWSHYALCGTHNPNWRDTLQQRPKPEPLCPVCGKPQSEHRDGLFCCPFCAGEWRRYDEGAFLSAHCRGCGHRTKKYKTAWDLAADVNRRA